MDKVLNLFISLSQLVYSLHFICRKASKIKVVIILNLFF
jgi:hypothetical protein